MLSSGIALFLTRVVGRDVIARNRAIVHVVVVWQSVSVLLLAFLVIWQLAVVAKMPVGSEEGAAKPGGARATTTVILVLLALFLVSCRSTSVFVSEFVAG